jgi:acyl-CoA thioester hydrolase
VSLETAAAGVAHELPVRVYFEDTDAGGIVYHANYLRFAERARTEFMRALGYDHRRLADEHGLLFAVARAELTFLAPARLDDLLTVRTAVTRAGGARLDLLQEVRHGARPVARVDIALALVDVATLRPKRMPGPLRQHFAAALAGTAATA